MIHYVIGDATRPETLTRAPTIIAHVTNNQGGWGAGFVLALEDRFPGLGARWRRHAQRLGDVDVDAVRLSLVVFHMCAQDGYKSAANPCPLNYEVLDTCLAHLGEYARDNRYVVAMPRIGCGLAGGTWDRVEPLLQKNLEGVNVYVYDLEQK